MENNKQEKTFGIIGTVIYLGILVLILLIIIPVSKEEFEPGGMEINFGTSETGMGDEQPLTIATIAGGGLSAENNYLTSEHSDDAVSSSDNTSNNSNNANNTNNTAGSNSYSGMLSDIMNNSKGHGDDNTGGDEGSIDGGIGGDGDKGIKGGKGSGTSLGWGDALSKSRPVINEPQDAKVRLKLEVDKDGNIVGEPIIMDGGAASLEARKLCIAAAKKMQFAAEPKAKFNRVAYITYDLTKGSGG